MCRYGANSIHQGFSRVALVVSTVWTHLRSIGIYEEVQHGIVDPVGIANYELFVSSMEQYGYTLHGVVSGVAFSVHAASEPDLASCDPVQVVICSSAGEHHVLEDGTRTTLPGSATCSGLASMVQVQQGMR